MQISQQAVNANTKVVSKFVNAQLASSTNIDFEAWGDYLGDAPLAMALLDRIVDRSIILKMAGRSYRAHRSHNASSPQASTTNEPTS